MREYALMILKYEKLYRLAFENAPLATSHRGAVARRDLMLGKVFWHAARETERGRLRWTWWSWTRRRPATA